MALQHIPPIQCLVTFETVARLRSATRAADELCVTTSAVSHRIRQLESHLGVELFGRSDFTLSAHGAAYLANVRSGLAALQQMPVKNGKASSTRLRVAVTPTFSRQFLMPKLELFRNKYPDIDLILQVSIPFLDVTAEPSDLEIRYGAGGYADVDHRVVLSEEVAPACSPTYLNEFGPFEGFEMAGEIDQARLIRSPLEPWTTWFSSCGLTRTEPHVGAQFNDLGLLYDAAACGFGVALVRTRMAQSWLEGGRLIRISDRSVPSPMAHYLCWEPGALERWECAAFMEWLTDSLS
ncbi:LysR substrate-binding domain-containing protein [Cupriavidus taiwanensis]|jgi:DNA-binding transcriptional LysR family regulator|uniref:Glycine cleavage system transcriptional activator n=10 Tax=root TaxID=1 RepID=A0A0C4YK88_9BURK|nr:MULTISPECIES: LysR substrate-binding domain-containing protein [Burkholderiaceae]AJG23483.1 Glycine cleavage system transcriptional activator [Cupriavidus basilensis]AMR78297.1 LysR family transcriptional regulator [Cupriavidus nantongensis]AZG14448.1 LysR family transcriptional regulator [Cupriavidus pauculus]MBU67541.1 LysR family transcriptional regulator [Cupriavidus sp.]MBY4732136.1 LysR family transcriptional regulator [Cupriavidus pauculus]